MARIVGYCRISTKMQLEGNSLEQQRQEIKERYENVLLIDEQYSGASKDRPEFNRIVQHLQKGDTLVVTKLDRFCRTVREGLEYIDILLEKGVKIHILNMGLIENTPMGKLITTSLLAFAEFERAMIIERTQAGKVIAKQDSNYREGRPRKYSEEKLNFAIQMLQTHSYRQVEKYTSISRSTLAREVRKRKT